MRVFPDADYLVEHVLSLNLPYVLATIRWSRQAGVTDTVLFRTQARFAKMCQSLPKETNVIVFPRRTPLQSISATRRSLDRLSDTLTGEMEWLLLAAADTVEHWSHPNVPYHVAGHHRYELEEALPVFDGQDLYFFDSAPSWEREPRFESFVGNVRGIY